MKTPAGLSALEQLFADCAWPEQRSFTRARKRAREHALDMFAAGPGDGDSHAALLAAAADLVTALSVERATSPDDSERLFSRLERLIGVSRIELAREVLRGPELLALPPDLALEVQLGTLVALAPLRSASLWTREDGGRVKCRCHVGEGRPSRRAHQLATKMLAGERVVPSGPLSLQGISVVHADCSVGVLVGSARNGKRELCHALLSEAVPMLAALLQRDILVAEQVASQRALMEASERKLLRLGFDLHDGPIQNVAAWAQDLRLFRDQLERLLAGTDEHDLMRGRVEDLEARLAGLDVELRSLASEVSSASVLLNRPFEIALHERIEAFAARTGVEPSLTLVGETSVLSPSQQIALLNVIQEALSNVREHAHAKSVEIALSVAEDGVKVKVRDDGRGFDLASTLKRAGRDGRIGLLAMNERARLLGGQCQIDTRPGGPTVVSLALERWTAPAEESRLAQGAQ